MIIITARKEGFRRCGIAHSKSPASYPDDRFTADELTVLQDEPMLIVTITENDQSKSSGMKAQDAIAVIKAAESIAALEEFTQGEERKSVIAAFDARRKELEA